MKFLIDENLSPKLVDLVDSAVHECVHAIHRGLSGKDDGKILERVLDESWTLVTNNSKDFQPRPGSKSTRPRYVGVELHAGLVCLNVPPNMPKGISLEFQKIYFLMAIDNLPDNPPDLTNKIMVVEPEQNHPDPLTSNVVVKVYEYPEDT